MTTAEHGRRWVVIVVVAALHVLFLLALLMRDTVRVIARGEPLRDSVLFFIKEEPRPSVTPPPPVPTQPTIRTNQPSTVIEPAATSDAPTTTPVAPPAIDWSTQATQAATAAVDKAIRQETRKCDPSDRPSSFLPPCTPPPRHEFKWKEPKVGFSQGLPFVRLGERCVVGLGFFGCGFGAKPPPDGDLFEGMDDPERDRSSVPALDDPPSRRQHVPSLPGPSNDRSETARQQ